MTLCDRMDGVDQSGISHELPIHSKIKKSVIPAGFLEKHDDEKFRRVIKAIGSISRTNRQIGGFGIKPEGSACTQVKRDHLQRGRLLASRRHSVDLQNLERTCPSISWHVI